MLLTCCALKKRKMKTPKILLLLPLLLLVVGCDRTSAQQNKAKKADAGSPAAARYTLAEAFPQLSFDQPVELTSPRDGTDRIFVLAQKGQILVFPNKSAATRADVFLDITPQVVSGGERGLLGLAFHPNYRQNGFFYVNYTRGEPLETVVSRFKVSAANPNQADPNSEQVLLTFRQPYSNHNGGKVAFGKDGYLYISAGDGGSGGDPQS